MSNFFWDETLMKESANPNPTILAIGDSWFWYPFYGGSLINNLGPLVRSKGHVIFAKGMNGAEAAHYVGEGKYAKSVATALKLYGAGLEAVFISGGGNDFAGFAQMRPLLKLDCSTQEDAKSCFRMEGTDGLKEFLDDVDKNYRRLIGEIYTRTSPNCKIVMHTYAYALPNGIGVFGKDGWLLPALIDAGVRPELHRKCVEYLLTAFRDKLYEISENDPAHLLIVDSREALGPEDWANELHPNKQGFEKIAKTYWLPVLRQAGLAE